MRSRLGRERVLPGVPARRWVEGADRSVVRAMPSVSRVLLSGWELERRSRFRAEVLGSGSSDPDVVGLRLMFERMGPSWWPAEDVVFEMQGRLRAVIVG